MSTTRFIALLAFALLLIISRNSRAHAELSYPEARRTDHVDHYHDIEVPDPYRWLEQDPRSSREVADWITAENRVTRDYLDKIPRRKSIEGRLTQLWNYPRYSVPQQVAGRYFFQKNDGLQNQAVLYWDDRCDGTGQALIDPNKWAQDGTVALGQFQVSDDGQLLAFSRREAGSDWSTIQVMEVRPGDATSAEGGRLRDDLLRWVRFGAIVWNAESTGFYYARYPEPEEGKEFQALAHHQMICFHQLGTPQADDQLIYRRDDHPDWSFDLVRTEDDRYLILTIYRGTDPQNQVLVRPVDANHDAWVPLVEDFANEFALIGNDGGRLFFMTDLEAPTKRVVAIDLKPDGSPAGLAVEHGPTEHQQSRPDGSDRFHSNKWQPILGAEQATLQSVCLLDGKLVATYLKDVATRLRIFSIAGESLHEIELPGLGSAYGVGGRQESTETFFTFSSYATPATIFRVNVRSGKSVPIRKPQVAFDPAKYEVEQHFYLSKDKTRVPILLAHRRGMARDGRQPTLLYGYGGFNISIRPYFSVEYAIWMEMGGLLAVPNLRGGGEYGEAWHAAGKKLNKQNVFDDFIAAAEWLIAQRYTAPAKLAIRGGSNGGLLVGACMIQRPELFGACLPAVGVMDMLRFHRFTAGHFWRDEYGSAEDPNEFRALLAYSPYHNLRPDVHYPATLITTADTDDRVVPMHSFKFAAALQHAQAGEAPVLLRVETRAGHGAGTPTSKRIEQAADRWAFLAKALGME
jgi:prolyl oligopeptidase